MTRALLAALDPFLLLLPLCALLSSCTRRRDDGKNKNVHHAWTF
jgi:hypothetical protein